MFKKVDKLKKGQYVRLNGQLYMLGYKHYTPMLMHCVFGNVLQGKAVSSYNTWAGMPEATFKDAFDKHRSIAGATIEFLELVEGVAARTTVAGIPVVITTSSTGSTYRATPAPRGTVSSF